MLLSRDCILPKRGRNGAVALYDTHLGKIIQVGPSIQFPVDLISRVLLLECRRHAHETSREAAVECAALVMPAE